LPLIGIIAVVVVVVAIGAMIVVKLAGGGAATAMGDNQPVPPTVITAVTQAPAAAFDTVGKGSLSPQPVTLPGPPLKSSGGKPEVLYIGSEYCPYCAAQRWPMIVALSRFGQWSGLELMTSSSSDTFPSTNTFTFVHATFTSQYLSLSSVELQTNKLQGQSYAPLQTMTPEQSQLMTKFNAPPYVPADAAGTIPFLDVANRFVVSGTLFSPALLQTKNWQVIAGALGQPSSDEAKAIIGAANFLTAEFCAVDGNQPAAVCSSSAVQQFHIPAS